MLIIYNLCIFHSKDGVLSYKAQSQDEEALVRAAAQLHLVFVKKNANILGNLVSNDAENMLIFLHVTIKSLCLCIDLIMLY